MPEKVAAFQCQSKYWQKRMITQKSKNTLVKSRSIC